MKPVAQLANVGVRYRDRIVLDGITGSFERGSLTAVTGPNGAGKSTLLKALAGVTPLTTGSIELAVPRERLAYLAQQSNIDREFPVSVLDCVSLGFWPSWRVWRRIPAAKIDLAWQALEEVGLSAEADKPVSTLSSGQFQRLLFARVQVQDAEFILLDEPFNAVDARTTADLLRIIHRWCQEGRTVVVVMHDHEQIRSGFPSCLLLANGNLMAWGSTAQVLTREHLFHAGQWVETRTPRAAA